MKLTATTVIRHSVIDQEATGQLLVIDWDRGELVIDWDRGEIEKAMPVPLPKHPSSNTNPRGGLRGGFGIKFWEDHTYVTNYDTVYVYDRDWTQIAETSHPLATDIHEIDIGTQGLWLSCSRYDLILQLSFKGNLLAHWHISNATGLMRKALVTTNLHRRPNEHNPSPRPWHARQWPRYYPGPSRKQNTVSRQITDLRTSSIGMKSQQCSANPAPLAYLNTTY